MSYGSINSSASGKGVRSNHRSQYHRFRCSSVAEAMEYWDTEIESGRHLDSFKAYESTARRRPQLALVGSGTQESED